MMMMMFRTRVQARLIKGIQKPRPEFETVGACLIMLHGISDAGANFECWYVEFLGHQEQHLEFIDAAAAHMSAYDDNPRAQARAILGTRGRQSHSHILDPKPLARWWLQHSTVECLR